MDAKHSSKATQPESVMKTRRALLQRCLPAALLLFAFPGEGQPVTQIAGGQWHSLFVKGNGSLWVMGADDYGQLGNGSNNTTNLPEQIVGSNVKAIAAGGG